MKLPRYILIIFFIQYAWATHAPAQQEISKVDFNFDNVEVQLLAQVVSELTERQFIIDAGLDGKVTVITPARIDIDEVYPVFLKVLESSGYGVRMNGEVHEIYKLPGSRVRLAPLLTGDRSQAEGSFVTKIIPVNHISALEVKKMLDELVSDDEQLAMSVFGPSNHLIITDTPSNIAEVEHILAELDQPGTSSVIKLVPLQYAEAEAVAEELGRAMRGAESTGKQFTRQVKAISEGAGSLPGEVGIVAASHANQVVLIGSTLQIKQMEDIIRQMDVEPTSKTGRLHVLFLQYLSAEEASENLNALLAKKTSKESPPDIAIEANVAYNALLVDASPRDYELVKSMIAQLDRIPEQVLVEVMIAEVTGGTGLDVGVNWATIDQPEDGKTTIIGRSRPGEEDLLNTVLGGLFPQGLTFGLADGTIVDANGNIVPRIPFILEALSQDRDVRILSNVPLWAQNNREAMVSVVENIPLLKSTIEGGTGDNRDVIQNIERVDVGIKLTMTPHVNPNEDIQLDLKPSVEAIIDEGPADQPFTPTIAKREVSTTITVPNESTVIISGLMREDIIENIWKVPLLGDIPVLGWLFQKRSERKQKTNLLIFVTPHLVTDHGDKQRLYDDLREADHLQQRRKQLGIVEEVKDE